MYCVISCAVLYVLCNRMHAALCIVQSNVCCPIRAYVLNYTVYCTREIAVLLSMKHRSLMDGWMSRFRRCALKPECPRLLPWCLLLNETGVYFLCVLCVVCTVHMYWVYCVLYVVCVLCLLYGLRVLCVLCVPCLLCVLRVPCLLCVLRVLCLLCVLRVLYVVYVLCVQCLLYLLYLLYVLCVLCVQCVLCVLCVLCIFTNIRMYTHSFPRSHCCPYCHLIWIVPLK